MSRARISSFYLNCDRNRYRLGLSPNLNRILVNALPTRPCRTGYEPVEIGGSARTTP